MSTLDVFPLETSAYLGDTQHLTLPQHGAYFLILITMWRAGGWIDDDDCKLARICKTTPLGWRKMAPVIRALLVSQDGKLTQKRLLKDAEITLARMKKCTLAGSLGGKAKALKNKETDVATASDSLFPVENHPMYKEVSKKEDSTVGRKRTSASVRFPQEWIEPDGPAFEFARTRGWDDLKSRTEFERFHRHHIGKATKWARWDLAWHTWVDNEVKWAAQRAPRNGSTIKDQRAQRNADIERALDEAILRERTKIHAPPVPALPGLDKDGRVNGGYR